MIDILVTASYISSAVFFVLGIVVLRKWYMLVHRIEHEFDEASKGE